MTAWLLTSPSLLDATFPRSQDELNTARLAILELHDLVSTDDYQILLTPVLSTLLTLVEWDGTCQGELHDLKRLLEDMVVRPAGRSVTVHFDRSNLAAPYPVLPCVASSSFSAEWSEEVGQLAELCCEAGISGPVVGIACAGAFAGKAECAAPSLSAPLNLIPITSPLTVGRLSNAYTPVYDANLMRQKIPLSSVTAHWRTLGARCVRKGSGTSHTHVLEFEGRSWPVDVNDDPIPPNNLRTLASCAHRPPKWVKTILLTGKDPALEPLMQRAARVRRIR